MSYKIIDIEQGTPEWLAMRQNHIGGSDAPVILNTSPWKTPYQLWREKLGFNENRSTPAMQRGLVLEESAREQFCSSTGLKVVPTVAVRTDIDFIMASFDGYDHKEKVAIEIKCPGAIDHEKALNKKVPEKYVAQLQHQMNVLDLSKMIYLSFDGVSITFFDVYRDDQFIENMIAEESIFWDNVQNFQSPELMDRDHEQRNDEVWLKKVAELLEVRDKMKWLKYLEKEETKIKEDLISMSDGKNCIGGGIKLTKVIRKGAIEYSEIPVLKTVDLEKHRKQATEYWKIA